MAQAVRRWIEAYRTIALRALAGWIAMVVLLASCSKRPSEPPEVAPSDASVEDIEIERACTHLLALMLKCKGEIIGPIEPRIESCIEVTRRSRGGLSEIGRACSAAATCEELKDCEYWVHGGNRPEEFAAWLAKQRDCERLYDLRRQCGLSSPHRKEGWVPACIDALQGGGSLGEQVRGCVVAESCQELTGCIDWTHHGNPAEEWPASDWRREVFKTTRDQR
jgi:hypothetical protein